MRRFARLCSAAAPVREDILLPRYVNIVKNAKDGPSVKIAPLTLLRHGVKQHEPSVYEDLKSPWTPRKTSHVVPEIDFKQIDAPHAKRTAEKRDGMLVKDQIAKSGPGYVAIVTKQYFMSKGESDPAYALQPEDEAFLKDNGYNMEDVKIWTSAVTNPDLDEAIEIVYQAFLKKIRSQGDDTNSPIMPLTIISLLLRRKALSSVALQRLLALTWTILRRADGRYYRDVQVFLIFTRFQRHLRQVWPQGLISAAALLTSFTPAQPWSKDHPFPGRQKQLNGFYNKAIELLSQATRIRPFLSYSFAERAQFLILSRMSKLEPYLSINNRAYAALVKVQLANRQTPQEEDWASLLSRSWPPVPEPKTRMDEHKDFDYGASRAVRTMQHMHLAGYTNTAWEKVAMVYAGWEADGTVSVQTRKIIKSFPTINENPEPALGAARIDVARDVREAWSAFLQYEANNPPHLWVYFAMFRKLASEVQRQKHELRWDVTPVPGGRELSSPAASSLQKLYLPSEPPTFIQFYRRMISTNVIPQGQFLGFLMSHSSNMDESIEIWRHATGQTFHNNLIDSVRQSEGAYPMDESSFAGFIDILCRTPFGNGAVHFLNRSQMKEMRQTVEELRTVIPHVFTRGQIAIPSLVQALCFTMWRKKADMRVWLAMINTIVDTAQKPYFIYQCFSFFPFVLKLLELMTHFNQRMEPDFFAMQARYTELAIRSARLYIQRQTSVSSNESNILKEARFVVQKAPTVLRTTFASLTSSAVPEDILKMATVDMDVPAIPASLTLFTTYDCLRYVRALLAASDYEGLYSWIKWLVAHETEMEFSINEQHGGMNRWNYTIGMIRLSLEEPWVMLAADPSGIDAAGPSEELKELIKDELGKLKILPGWMSDQDLEKFKTYKLIY